MLSAWGIMAGLTLLALSLGLQASLLGVRAGIEGFSTEVTGLIMSGYPVGLIAGIAIVPKLLPRMGHGPLFAVLTSLATCALLAQASFAHPAIWGAMRVVVGFGCGGLLMIAEHWLSDHAPGAARARLLPVYLTVGHTSLLLGQALLLLGNAAGFQLFSLAAVITSLALVPILASARRTPKDTPLIHIGLWHLFRGSPLAAVTALGSGSAFGAVFWMGGLYGRVVQISDLDVCLLLGSFLGGGVLLQWPVLRLSRRLNRRGVIATLSFAAAIASFGAVFVALFLEDVPGWASFSKPSFFIAIALIGGLSQSLAALAIGHAIDRFGSSETCAVGGSLTLLFLIGSGLGPFGAGFMMSPRLIGHNGLFLFLTLVHLALATYTLYRMARREGLPAEDQGPAPPTGPSASPMALGMAVQALRISR